MSGAQADPKKWNMPGWKIEPRYSDQTLIGNWLENRKYFNRENFKHTSSNRMDYISYPDHRPDVTRRRHGTIRHDGLPETLFTRHHGDKYDNLHVTWYDENYNRRARLGSNKLPSLRNWSLHKIAWVPEKSDHPIQGIPTSIGLMEKKKEQWRNELDTSRANDYITNYSNDFKSPPHSAFPDRYGVAPKILSSHFHPITIVNKNLSLRNEMYNAPQEYSPNIPKPSKTYPIVPPLPC